MGRFKIYDASRFVKILSDTNYAKCFMCDKTLKNIMGNIKRHYEQMHSICVDANPSKKKKSKRKATQNEDNYQHLSGKSKKVYQELKQNVTTTTVVHSIKDKKEEIIDLEELDIIPKAIITAKITSRSSPKLLESTTKIKDEKHTNLITKDNKINETLQQTLKLATSTEEQPLLMKNDVNFNNSCLKYNIHNIQITFFDSCNDFFNCTVATNMQLNIPLKILQEGYTFQKSLSTWKQDNPLNINTQTIGEYMDKLLKKMRQEIIQIAKNKLVYLKLDIASTKECNIMLVNIQFIKDFEIKVLTLSVLELLNEHLATYLKEKVLKVLECYDIDISRVHSITKDHSNNIKNIQMDEKAQQESLLITQTDYNEYCQHLSEQFPGHSIHFVACDIIKQLNENISQSRDAVKSLRRKMSQLHIKEMPVLDNCSSWLSIYDMIKSLLNIQEKVENNSSLNIEVDWIFAKKFETSFKPIIETVSMLQTNNFIMGDFYREWLLCECELEDLAISNEIALYLLQTMQKRKLKLFENSAFLAALYLDARFCYMGSMHLNDKQKEMARNYLLEIFNKLKTLQTNEETCTPHTNLHISKDRYRKLEKKLEQNMTSKTKIEIVNNPATTLLNKVDPQWLKESLQNLQFEERLAYNTNILDYWKLVKHKNSILAQIAEIALAVPATQATINRALNAWPIAVQKRKFNINSDNIENLLLLKLNQDLVDKISLEDKHS